MLSKETIRQELDDITHKLQQKYNEKYIFGVFVLGNATYNLAEDIDELAYMMVRLPSFEEMCLRTPEIFFDEDYPNVEIIDWGVFGNFYVQQNNILIQQFLFTDYYNVNPRYKKYYENIIRPAAEDIFAYGHTARLQSAKEIALEILKSEQMCLTGLQAMEVARLALAIDLYLHNTPCEECVKLNKSMYISYLLDIKHGNTAINPDELLTQMTIPSAKNNEEPKQIKQLIEKITIDILRMAVTKDIDEQYFLQCLTAKEKIALDSLLNYLDEGEGNVSIVKMIEKAGVSRPVFMGLIQKMKDHKIAEIKNMGVKGTYFHILNQNLLS